MTLVPCDFCGLPVALAGNWTAERNPQPVYCCFGCEFAAEVTQSGGREGANRILLLRIGLAAFCTMNVLAFTMVLWSHDVYPGTSDVRAAVLDDVLRYLGLLFSLPVWFVLGQPLLLSAIGNLRRGIPATDFLVCLGVLAAYGFSMVSTWRGSGAVYYEVACVILVLITLGRWLESQGKLQASSALDELERLLPEVVRVLRETGEVSIPVSEVRIGDRLLIHAGECISVDGTIASGCAHVDERLLTGESWPIEKQQGDPVRAGAFSLDGHLELTATSSAADGSLGRLVRGLHDARRERGRYERLAERATSWFLPAIMLIALGTVVWHGWFFGLETGVMTGLSVLLIACPCALGLATPLAAWTAFSHAARHQVLFRSGEALERLASIKILAWDKTGTLTTSKPSVEFTVWNSGGDQGTLLSAFVGLAENSNHPFSKALVHSFGGQTPSNQEFHTIREHPGRGLVGQLSDGTAICLGSPRFAEDLKLSWSPRLRATRKQLESEGRPIVIGGCAGAVESLFVIAETLRPGAAQTVQHLQRLGLGQVMLTGDQQLRAERLARLLFEPEAPKISTSLTVSPRGWPHGFQVISGLLPDQKVIEIQQLRQKYGVVAMVGDGVNDAPALTAADVGISLRSGADISRDAAAVCLFGDDISRLPWAIEYARFTVRIIRQNLGWAFGYNTIGVTLASMGYLNPSLAAALMVGSSVFVIANSCRLHLETPELTVSTTESSQTTNLAEISSVANSVTKPVSASIDLSGQQNHLPAESPKVDNKNRTSPIDPDHGWKEMSRLERSQCSADATTTPASRMKPLA